MRLKVATYTIATFKRIFYLGIKMVLIGFNKKDEVET